MGLLRRFRLTIHSDVLTILAVVLMFLGYLLNPLPSDPDQLFALTSKLGALFVFLSFSISVLSWGRVIGRAFRLVRRDVGRCVALGTAAAVLLTAALGHLGLVGYDSKWLVITALLLGPLICAVRGEDWVIVPAVGPRPARSRFRTWAEPLAAVALVGLLCLQTLPAFQLQFHSDTLYYHFIGPRLWAAAGRISFTSTALAALQCSYWEYLYLLGQTLLGGPKGGGLIEAQYFAQWTHFFLGYVATLAVLRDVLARLSEDRLWRRLGLFATAAGGVLNWTSWVGKNDYGVILWALAGAALLEESPLAAGLLFGIAVAAKISTVVTLLPVVAVWFAFRFRDRRGRLQLLQQTGVLVLAGALSSLPIFLRNWLWVDSPVYPYLNSIFHSPWVTARWEQMTTDKPLSTTALLLSLVPGQLKTLLIAEPLIVAGFLPTGYLAWRERRRNPMLAQLWLATALSFVLFVPLVSGPTGDGFLGLRYLGPALPIAVVLSAAGVAGLLKTFRAPEAVSAVLALALVGYVTSRLTLAPENLWGGENEVYALRDRVRGGTAKAWLRLNANPGDVIATTGDSQVYPIADLDYVVLSNDPFLDSIVRGATENNEAIDLLRSAGVRYLLDTVHWQNRFWTSEAMAIGYIAFLHPEAIVFTNPEGYILDLNRIRDEDGGRCYK